MKKLFKATPMKKLLLASSILAISSTAIAANTNTSPLLDTAVTNTLTVTAKYVTPIAVSLDTTSIDFGDVWTDSDISTVEVIAEVTGEANETFSYTIKSNGNLVKFAGDDYSATETVGVAFDTTTQKLNFTVGLDTSNAATATTISETITVQVNYDAIADTDVDMTPVT
jgi:hypothetical protein